MNTNMDLKELWNKQEAIIPDSKELIEKANSFKKKSFRKMMFSNALLAFTSIFIISIWYYYQPQYITTKIGIILCVLAMLTYSVVYTRMMPFLVNVGFDMSNNNYLQQLLKIKEKQLFLHGKMMSLYYVLLSTGLALYLYEYTHVTMKAMLLGYGLTFLWIAFAWFVIRPKSIAKQQASLNELIEKFESMSKQLNAE